jgi:hypothetical protein
MELGQQHSPTRNLGTDMLRERGLHQDYVTALLQDGYFLEALRYARKYKVLDVCLCLGSSFPIARYHETFLFWWNILFNSIWIPCEYNRHEDWPRLLPCILPCFWRKPWRRTAPRAWPLCWVSSASSRQTSRPRRTSVDTGIFYPKWFERFSYVRFSWPEMIWKHVLH